jgi:hypothetical protein
VASGAERARLDYGNPVNAVAFSTDGTLVAMASAYRSAGVLEAALDLLVQRVIDVMPRTLNTAELRRYSLSPNCQHVQRWLLREILIQRARPWQPRLGDPAAATYLVGDTVSSSGARIRVCIRVPRGGECRRCRVLLAGCRWGAR